MSQLKAFLVLFCSFVSVSFASGVEYYASHPAALEKALMSCPDKHPHGTSCDELTGVATNVNQLVSELKWSPQAYGLSILALETTLGEQTAQNKTPVLQQSILQNQQRLHERLSIIAWLESPGR